MIHPAGQGAWRRVVDRSTVAFTGMLSDNRFSIVCQLVGKTNMDPAPLFTRHGRALRICAWLVLCLPGMAAGADQWSLVTWSRPFDYTSTPGRMAYRPLSATTRPWRLCVAYPHMKDAYWLSVNFGMVDQARRLGVGFNLVEAGGYPNLKRQLEQVEQCTRQELDALIVGTVTFA